jgi:hypothetical protein
MAHVISSLGLADWILKIQLSDKNNFLFFFILLKYHFPYLYLLRNNIPMKLEIECIYLHITRLK